MRVLIVKTSSMGDILHTLPALTDAQLMIPDISFDWVVEENFQQIPSWHSAVKQTIPVAIRRWRKNLFNNQTHQEWQQFKQQLTNTNYDAVIDAQGLIKSAWLITRKAHGIKHGYDYKSAREGLSSLAYDCRYNINYQQHAVERIRKLFAASLGYTLNSEQGDYAIAQHFIDNTKVNEDYVMLFHATTRDAKHWLEAEWRKLIQMLANHNLKVKLAWGNQAEYERAMRLAQGFEHVEVLPKLDLSSLAKYIANAKATVSVDTGLSHLAAALDKTNITLFGPTDPKLVGGYGKNQHPIKQNTMADISAEMVMQQLIQIL